jgi:hypothetical protein
MNAIYLTRTETAGLIRSALKLAFPCVMFSVRVRTFAGGSSCDIAWTDGPTTAQVDAVAGGCRYHRFDGMNDMGYSVSHWLLPDGRAVIASGPGTTGSAGTHEPIENPAPAEGAKLVRMSIGYVGTRRQQSRTFLVQALDRLKRRFGPEKSEGMEVTERGEITGGNAIAEP